MVEYIVTFRDRSDGHLSSVRGVLHTMPRQVSALEQLLQEKRRLHEGARLRLVLNILEELRQFPRVLLDDEALPSRPRSVGKKVRLFPLGDFRPVLLGSLGGKTTLYLGSNGRLYEYAPAQLYAGDMEDMEDNLIKLRVVTLTDLRYPELMDCLNLLQRIWLV